VGEWNLKQDRDELVRLLRHLDKHGFVSDPEIIVDVKTFQNLVTEVLQE
jgi:hypothetical protein